MKSRTLKSIYGVRSINVIRVALFILAAVPPASSQTEARLAGGAGDAVALADLGFTYAKASKYEKAVEALTRAVRLNPESAEAQYLLGAVYNNMGRFEEATGAFREAVRLKPAWGEAYSGLGVAYNCAGRFEESLTALTEAIRLEPNWAQAYVNLSATYANLRRFGEAAEASRMAIQLAPRLAEAHYRLGRAQGLWESAGRHSRTSSVRSACGQITPRRTVTSVPFISCSATGLRRLQNIVRFKPQIPSWRLISTARCIRIR